MNIKKKMPLLISIIVHAAIISLIIIGTYHVLKAQPKQKHLVAALPNVYIAKQPGKLSTNHSVQWIQKLFHGEVNIGRSFHSFDHLTGHVVSLKSNRHDQSIIYTDPNNQYIIIGTVISKSGVNISERDSSKYLTNKLNHSIYSGASKLSGVFQGDANAKHIVTIIIDPSSKLFSLIYNNLKFDVANKLFSVKWVLVNYLKPDGSNLAGEILQSSNPSAMLKRAATHGLKENHQMRRRISQVALKYLSHHWNFVQTYQLYKLPITIFKANNHIHVVQGMVIDEMLENYFSTSMTKKTTKKLKSLRT